MKLSISSLPFGKQEFNYHVDGEFFNEIEASEVRSGSVDVALPVTHTQEGIYELDFVCNGVITIPCDRCLDDMEHMVDTDYLLTVKMGDALDDSVDGVLVIPSSWRTLDLAPLVRDTVLLSLPMTHCHENEDDCNADMLNVLDSHSVEVVPDDDDNPQSVTNGTDPRWEALKKLTEQ